MFKVSTFILAATGSFFLWAGNGFRGSFNDQMISYTEHAKWKGNFRILLGALFWILVTVSIGRVIFKPAETRYYQLTPEQAKQVELEMKKQSNKPQ